MMKLTIGIKALNEQEHIEKVLVSALNAAAPYEGQVLLADSGSTDGTLEIAERYPVDVFQLTHLNERSCGAGAQLAFQSARGEFFYLLDGDMVLDAAFLEPAISFLDSHPEAAGVGGRVVEVNTKGHGFKVRAQAMSGKNWRTGQVDHLDCGGLYRAEAVRALGYFADCNLHAFEEMELGARLRTAGWSLHRLDIHAIDHYGHTDNGYRLLIKRLKSGYAGAVGEVLRGAWGKAHLPAVLRACSHVRHGFAVMAWWLMLVAALTIPSAWATSLQIFAVLILGPLLALSLRRRSLNLGLYSLVSWNVTAIGMIARPLPGATPRRTAARVPHVAGRSRAGSEDFRHMMACAVQRLGNTIFALALVGGLIPVSGWSEPIQAMLWKPVSIGAGGYITGIASDPENRTRLIRTDVYGGYRWDATQDRWVQLVTSDAMPAEDRVQNGMASGVFAMAVADGYPSRVYMASKGRLYRSSDAGLMWHRSADGRVFQFDANSPMRHIGPAMMATSGDADRVFFGAPEEGLYSSRDGGVHWTPVPEVPAARPQQTARGAVPVPILIWEAAGGAVWAFSAGSGLYVQVQDAPFQKVAALGDAGPDLIRRALFSARGDFLAVGDDLDGKPGIWRLRSGRWENLSKSAGLRLSRPFAGIAELPDGRIIVADRGGTVLMSRTDGLRWEALTRRMVIPDSEPSWHHVADRSFFAVGDIQADGVDPDTVWFATGIGVFRGKIGAGQVVLTAWSRGIEELVANDVVAPEGQAPLFAAWDFGVHRMENPDAFSTGYGPKERVLIAAQQLDWSAGTPSFIVTNASDTMRCCAEDGDAVLAGFSLDGGRSWEKFRTLPTPPGTDENDPFRMSFGSIAVASETTSNIVWLPTGNRAPFYTKDTGRTWQQVHFPGERGTQTGSHAQFHYNRKTLTSDRVADETFYLLHAGEEAPELAGLWRTEDGGVTWTNLQPGPVTGADGYSAKLRAVPGHEGHLFLTPGVSDARSGLHRTRDGGRTWDTLRGVTQVDDIAFGEAIGTYPSIVLSGRVFGSYGIWRSIDDAASWQLIGRFPLGRLDQVSVVAAAAEGTIVYLGFRGSGWLYGEASDCVPKPFRQPDREDCFAVGSPVSP